MDLTTTVMGPYRTLLLTQTGADVIKVKPPAGDVVRYIGDERGSGMGPVFLNANQGKRSIVLDLKVPAGRDVLQRLVRTADVFVQNMRPDAVRRLGVGFEDVAAMNRRIIPGSAVRGQAWRLNLRVDLGERACGDEAGVCPRPAGGRSGALLLLRQGRGW